MTQFFSASLSSGSWKKFVLLFACMFVCCFFLLLYFLFGFLYVIERTISTQPLKLCLFIQKVKLLKLSQVEINYQPMFYNLFFFPFFISSFFFLLSYFLMPCSILSQFLENQASKAYVVAHFHEWLTGSNLPL